MTNVSFVPLKEEDFLPGANYAEMKEIFQSGTFFPFLVTGPTGSGKTLSVEQIHAEMNKPLYRVNITSESDEDSLMGGFRLRDGHTVFDHGPVVVAMKEGATLLLDEIDLARADKIMCLQSVMEGKGYLIKRTNEYVRPAPGFTVVATANTKMAGDSTGQYIGTQILNEAFRDRFTIVFDHPYPDEDQEAKILNRYVQNHDINVKEEKITHLIAFANKTRYNEDSDNFSLEYSVSTRRLKDILKIFKVFGDFDKAVKMGLSKFDNAIQESFLEYYRLTDPSREVVEEEEEEDVIVF